MQHANHWKLGLFLVLGSAAVLAVLAFLGTRHLRRETAEVHCFFNEPVDGLDLGSPLLFRGIRVGQVAAIRLASDRRHVEVVSRCALEEIARLGLCETHRGVEQGHFLESDLRAQLQRNPLTGQAVINADFLDPANHPPPAYPFPVPPNTIHTAPSVITGLLAEMEGLLRQAPESLRRLEELARAAQQSLDEARRALAAAELERTAADFRRTLQAVEAAGGGAAQAAGELERLGRAARAELDGLSETLAALRRLAEFLERDPGALLRGRLAAEQPAANP